ncbi:hypothetical protein SAMN05421853_1236 [Roseivivax halotolerans]|uniref:Uncharacterized protein n=1 Tax=Roseivivax halotolerans TaxID=93684 RepID=A0A1I6AKS5_9RHOB|nr:hypothetical protein [Roseivivax halotolerans]SFQ69117.1 hypothetical protein SAMN05421853_1236 [Roseivivax halotolerans]
MIENDDIQKTERLLKTEKVLSFKKVGRTVPLEELPQEFRLMGSYLKSKLTAEITLRVCKKSGSHLLKLVSARTEGDSAILYVAPPTANKRPKVLPSVNAPDIPFCKVLYRPLEIEGRPPRSVVDDIMNPDDYSDTVLNAFASVFGKDVLDAAREALLNSPKQVTKLAAGEFPIIFVPRAGGGDLQLTPVAPATAFMGVKAAINALYERKKASGLPIPQRGAFEAQSISSKPQNISGAIGGPRKRIIAKLPQVMEQAEAEIHRYIHGGSFPRWRDDAVAEWVIRYADMLEADKTYNDRNTRAALDRTADRLIRDAMAFVSETVEEARVAKETAAGSPDEIPPPPEPDRAILRRYWPKDGFDKARKALTSAHFQHRLMKLKDTESA